MARNDALALVVDLVASVKVSAYAPLVVLGLMHVICALASGDLTLQVAL